MRNRPVPAREAEWAHAASQHTDDLESFLRDMAVDESLNMSSRRLDTSLRQQEPLNTSSRRRDASLHEPSALESSMRVLPPLPPRSEQLPARPRTATTGRRPASKSPTLDSSQIEEEMSAKVRELDAQIEKFKKENEYCKRLRMEREVALAEAQRVRERAILELEAAEKDIETQRYLVASERKRMHQDKDRGHQMVSQLRQLTDENRELQNRISLLESELSEKSSKMKSEIFRLNGIVSDLTKTKAELDLELRAVLHASASLGSSMVKASPTTAKLDETQTSVTAVTSTFAHPDGRVDRVYVDGRREAQFASGLKKTVWPDGAALVRFPNGDVKETSAGGVVTYQYASTGCVQTTHPDGLEILQFPSGQVEKHLPDGSKEITFPNKIVKLIDNSGRESIISH